MLKISWTEHETNQNVLHKLHKERELLQIIKKRKLESFGHVIRDPKYRTRYPAGQDRGKEESEGKISHGCETLDTGRDWSQNNFSESHPIEKVLRSSLRR